MNKTIFWGSLIALIFVSIPLFLFPETTNKILIQLNDHIQDNFGYLYIWLTIVVVSISIYIIFTKTGNIKLGNSSPDYSVFSWASMLFCAGVATGILYWGTIEWAYYINSPPFELDKKSNEAIEWASTYGMFHWGFAGWSFYAIPGIVIGHAFYNLGFKDMRISTACKGVLGKYSDGFIGKTIDIFFMIGLLGSSGTSLGLGTPMIAAGINKLFGIEASFGLNAFIILTCAVIFATSVYLGMAKGIKRLSKLNVRLSFFFLLFVLITGPTVFILKMTTNSMGLLFQNFVRMITWTDPVGSGIFVEDWSIFYWSWWIAVGPFMGIFIAKISKGRTFRQIATGTLFFGSAGCALFYNILGNYALNAELTGKVMSSVMVEQGLAPEAIIEVIGTLVTGNYGIVIFCIMGIIFMATSFDSTSYVLATTTSKNFEKEPPRWQRLFWAFFLIVLPVALMFIGGIESLKTIVLISALPLIFVYIFMIISLYKWTKNYNYEN